MFITLKVFNNSELPFEEQISEVLINTDNINFAASNPQGGAIIMFNSPTIISESSTNMLVVNSNLHDLIERLKEKGLM